MILCRWSRLCRTRTFSSSYLWCYCPHVLPGFGALQPWVLSDMLHWYSRPVSDPHHCSLFLSHSVWLPPSETPSLFPYPVQEKWSLTLLLSKPKGCLNKQNHYIWTEMRSIDTVIESPNFYFILFYSIPTFIALLQLMWKLVLLESRCCIYE